MKRDINKLGLTLNVKDDKIGRQRKTLKKLLECIPHVQSEFGKAAGYRIYKN